MRGKQHTGACAGGAGEDAAADRFALKSRREAEDVLVGAALASVAGSGGAAPVFPFKACRAVVEHVMAPHVRGNGTLASCLADKGRAGLLSAVLKQGSARAGVEALEEPQQAYWRTLTAAFLDLAKRAPTTAVTAAE